METLRRKLSLAFDKPGCRWLLATATSAWARHLARDSQIGVTYDGMWIDVVDGIFIPRASTFEYYAYDILHMRRRMIDRLEGSLDYWTYVYEPKKGDVILDVGAGVGIDAIALSRAVGPSGHVHSVEAHPWTYSALRTTISLNHLSNVTPHHVAISDAEGHLWIETTGNDESNSVSSMRSKAHSTKVPAIDLDSFLERNRIDRVDLLKMNIEGAEELAIKGMQKSIGRISNVVIACHDFREGQLGTKEIVTAFLLKNGFEVLERPNDPRPYVRDHVHGRKS